VFKKIIFILKQKSKSMTNWSHRAR